jgi:hypothetical protein
MNAFDIYEGLVVYQLDTNQLWVLIDTANYNNDSGWQLVGTGAGGSGGASWISGSASNTYVSSSATTVTTVVGGTTTQTDTNTSITFGVPVTGSTFTGSFVGNGSGLTGVVATFPATQQTTLAGTDKVYVNDGTNKYATVSQFNSASWAGVSGDITINPSTGAATIAANSVALGTDTTGDYVSTITAGNYISSTGATTGEGIAHSLSVNTGTLTPVIWAASASYTGSIFTQVSGDISITAAGVATIAANSVALGTDTTGNYVGDVTAGAGLTKTSTASEGQTVDLAIGAGTHITVNADDVAVNTTTLVPAITGSIYTGITGDVTVTSAGVSAIGTGKVTSTMILDGTIVNNDINASAAIAYTKISFAGSSMVSASVLSSPSQGNAILTTNGVAGSTIGLGLQTTDSPQFVNTTLTGDLNVNGGDIFTTATTFNIAPANATTLNLGGASTTVNVPGNMIVTGDLTINGNTTILNTSQVYVEDQFILVASGSTGTSDGGIIVDRGGSGNIAFGWDYTTGRWGFQNGLTDAASALDPTYLAGATPGGAFVPYLYTSTYHGTTKPSSGEFATPGSMYIDDAGGDFWIYA